MIDLKTSKKENEINDNDQELSDEKNIDSDSLKVNDLFIKNSISKYFIYIKE